MAATNSYFRKSDLVNRLRPSVLFVIGDLDVGGAERHLVQLLPELAKQGFRPMVYTLTHKGRLAPHLEAAGIEVLTLPFSIFLRRFPSPLRQLVMLPLTMLTLWGLMLARRPAVVHFFLPAAYLLGGICSLLAPISVRIMSRRSLNNYQQKHLLLAPLERWLHPKMDAVLGNSAAIIAQLKEEGVPEARLGLIYNGIKLTDRVNREQARARLGIANDALVFVIVANLIPYKGHADLIKAMAAIKFQLPKGWLLLCVGRDAGIGEALAARARDSGIDANVLWMGERPDVHVIFCAADIGILCSHQEGFSNSVLEGMAAGLPMVVTDVGGNREAVVDGQCGIVVPPENPVALAQALLLLADDPAMRKRMGEAARQRICDEFSLTACVDRYALLYKALIGKVRSPVPELLAHNLAGKKLL